MPLLFGRTGNGGSAWVPTDIGGCVLWLRSDLGVTKDGSSLVSLWADQSGNGNDAAQATAIRRPIWTANQLNGQPGIMFDGLNDYFLCDGMLPLICGDDKPYSFFFVGRNDSVADLRCIWCVGAEATIPVYCAVNTAGNNDELLNSREGVASVKGPNGFLGYKLLSVIFDGTTISVWVDGTQIFDQAAMDAAEIPLGQNFGIGCMCAASLGWIAYHWNHNMMEIVFYDSAVSEPNRVLMENYLNTRYFP